MLHDHHRNLHVPHLQGHSLAGNNTVMAKNRDHKRRYIRNPKKEEKMSYTRVTLWLTTMRYITKLQNELTRIRSSKMINRCLVQTTDTL